MCFDREASMRELKESQRFWAGCDVIEIVPGKVSGAPVFKGTRLPADTIVDNVDAYMEEGMTLDEAIRATLDDFPGVPDEEAGARAVLAYRDAHEQQSVA